MRASIVVLRYVGAVSALPCSACQTWSSAIATKPFFGKYYNHRQAKQSMDVEKGYFFGSSEGSARC